MPKYNLRKGFKKANRGYHKYHKRSTTRSMRDVTFKASGAAVANWGKKGDYYECEVIKQLDYELPSGSSILTLVASVNDTEQFRQLADQFQQVKVKDFSVTALGAYTTATTVPTGIKADDVSITCGIAPVRMRSQAATQITPAQLLTMSQTRVKTLNNATPIYNHCKYPVLNIVAQDSAANAQSGALKNMYVSTDTKDQPIEYSGMLVYLNPMVNVGSVSVRLMEKYKLCFKGRKLFGANPPTAQPTFAWVNTADKLSAAIHQFPAELVGNALNTVQPPSEPSLADWNAIKTGISGNVRAQGDNPTLVNDNQFPGQFTPNNAALLPPGEE